MNDNRVFAYCRVSTMKQSLDRQIRNAKAEYPNAIIITDEYTGTKLNRPGWTKLVKQLRQGDTLVFDSVSRMSRDAEEGFKVYEKLFNMGVNMVFLKEHYIDSAVYASNLKQADVATGKDYLDEGLKVILMGVAKDQIKIAFQQAEQEVSDLHQRTKEGIREKKIRNEELKVLFPETYKEHPDYTHFREPKGSILTTKKSIKAKEIIKKRSKDFEGDLSDVEVMKLAGLARNTYYKYKRELMQG